MKPIRKYQREIAKKIGISTNDVAIIFNDFYKTAFDIFQESDDFVLTIPYTGKLYYKNENNENKTSVHNRNNYDEQIRKK